MSVHTEVLRGFSLRPPSRKGEGALVVEEQVGFFPSMVPSLLREHFRR